MNEDVQIVDVNEPEREIDVDVNEPEREIDKLINSKKVCVRNKLKLQYPRTRHCKYDTLVIVYNDTVLLC